ncbi:MAG: hypothetical protein KAS32_10095 [Candidatus Peribacteraceae bacterium]|nr:hypothetical protein [Candidatus Peribacteraceae bacterium]
MEIGDRVKITDGSYAKRLDAYEEYASICLCPDIFEVLRVINSGITNMRDIQVHDLVIRNTENGRIYLHSQELVKLVEPKTAEITPKQKCLDRWYWHMLNPGKDGFEYIRENNKQSEENIKNICWACESIYNRGEDRLNCSKCPITMFRGNDCFFGSSLYKTWLRNKSSENAKAIYDAILVSWEE